jgi:hypothetical protein
MMENVVTMLGWSPQGGTVARMMEGTELPDEYGLITERCIAYWTKNKRPPGVHLTDLFEDVFEHPNDPRAPGLRFILSSMLAIKDGLNPEFVLSRMKNFRRANAISRAVLDVATRIQKGGDTTVEEAEAILHDLMRAREVEFDPGLTLQDVDQFIGHLTVERGMRLDIEPLDTMGVTPARKTLHTMLSVTGQGKTWWLVHVGAQALRQRLKVCHVSLEIDAPSVLQRYYQTLFTASEYQVKHAITELHTDDTGRMTKTTVSEADPEFAFRRPDKTQINPELHNELTSRLRHLGGSAANLRIKTWPPRVVSIDSLEAYLDTLADTEHFEPDVLLIDYPQLMKLRVRDYRLELGQVVENLRRLAIERNLAVCIVHQANRIGAKAKSVGMAHVGEDWSVVQTSDFLLTYSATDSEKRLGLARLHVDKARVPGALGRTMILTQNYDLGQYAISAVLMPSNYLDYMEASASAPPRASVDDDASDSEDNLDDDTYQV